MSMFLRRFRIGTQLTLAFGSLVLLIALIEVVNVIVQHRVQAMQQRAELWNDLADNAERWANRTQLQVDRARTIARHPGDAELRRDLMQRIAETRAEVDRLEKMVTEAVTEPQHKAILDKVSRLRKAHVEARSQVLKLAEGGAQQEVVDFARQRYEPAAQAYLQSQDELAQLLRQDADAAIEQAQRMDVIAQKAVLVAGLVAIALGILIGVALHRGIVPPMRLAV